MSKNGDNRLTVVRTEGRRRERLRFVVRILVIWAIEILGLLFMAWLLPSVRVETLTAAVVAVGAIGIVNALFWPLLSYLILPFVVLTLVLLSLAVNAGLVLLADALVAGFQVEGFWPALWLTLPFLMFPADLPAPDEGPMVGAASLHAVLKGWTGSQAS